MRDSLPLLSTAVGALRERVAGAPLLVLLTAACASGVAPAPAGTPAPDPESSAAALIEVTTPTGAKQISFSWELDEAGSRVSGRGVVRMEAPRRLRLDLFGPRGESYLAAALEDETVRVPPAVASRFTLPPPAFLWGALGVIRPPANARLLDASVLGERTTLRYALDAGEVMTFHAEGGILRSVRRLKDASVLESIEISQRGEGTRSRAEYRNPRAFRTLVLIHESTVDAASFPESTWYPAGAPR